MGSTLSGLISLVILALDIWAIVNILKSAAETAMKIIWVLRPAGARPDHLGHRRPARQRQAVASRRGVSRLRRSGSTGGSRRRRAKAARPRRGP